MSLDLSKAEDVQNYLQATSFASTSVVPLSGGNANFTFRLHLCAPYERRMTVVLKHAKSYAAFSKSFKFAVERQDYETEALKRVKDFLPVDSIVTVPVVHLYDKETNVIIMDDCGADSLTLKQLMLVNTPNEELARTIGKAVGEFLACIHIKGCADLDFLKFFDRNQEGKKLSAWVTYGRLVETLTNVSRSRNGTALIDPPLSIPNDDILTIEQLSTTTTEHIVAANSAFVMGDFWPGNIIISIKKSEDTTGMTTIERIFVVDWEVAKTGVLGLDIGQFAAEMHQMREFYPDTKKSADTLLQAFLAAYSNSREVDRATAQTAAVHVGAHLVAWTPRTGWSPMERTRDVVLQGVEYLLKGWEGNEEWLKESAIGGLMSETRQ
ncbi:hypothetical protein BD410DRAFT_299299 [Rickenella mellea]|uniref:Uncharacterized protein n=1 Tax=Rickenella mellea TaxID=50990 RepID=A0A4Y7Q379_9AGAM|nr:hypothetical protein BD410DRAFT_299299 [Rickenella mellea]